MASTQIGPARWRILLAFAAIYLIWGSTYLAIRVGVAEAPPLLFAGARFVAAGLILFAWTQARKTPLPTAREWRAVSLVAVLIFVCDYGLLFWSEQRVPSGIAAVIMSTIPIFTGLLEIIFLRTQRLTARLGLGFLVGFAGVALVMSTNLFSEAASSGAAGGAAGAAGDWRGYAALLVAALSWSAATILTRKVALPASKTMSAAAQMLVGGAMLLIVAAAFGDFRGFHIEAVTWRGWVALAYLIGAGSLAGFTAYVWLIHHESPTKVGTYAYVNPVVAVILGTTLGAEMIGWRAVVGMLFVLVSVALITTASASQGAAAAGGAGGSGGSEAEREAQAAVP